MKLRLELVPVPVSDVDRAKTFYQQVGFNADHDTKVSDEIRFVQLTPPGSACSIVIGGPTDLKPGSLQGLHLVVSDIRAARADLVERGVEISDVQVYDSGSMRPSRDGDALDNVGFAYFSDPDGNGWALQQISARE